MNKYEARSASTYNKKADSYDSTFDGKFTYKFKKKLLSSIKMSHHSSILDIACGNGRFPHMLSQLHPIQGYGVDLSEKMVENAQRLNPSMIIKQAACDTLPFSANLFDAVTVCVAFHHFPRIAEFAREALRVLKPGGTIYIAEVYYPVIIRMLLNPFVAFSKAGDIKFYAPAEIQKLLRDNGYGNIAYETDGNIMIVSAQK